MSKIPKKVVIIGGGLAGLALGAELVEENFEVVILEKSNHLGGRASNTFDRKMDTPVPIGPHVFVTAYNNFRRFLKKIDAEGEISWQRKVLLEGVYKGTHHRFTHSHIPHPLYMVPWLATYPFMSFGDKVSHFRFGIDLITKSTKFLESLDGITAYDYLLSRGVSERAVNVFWRFLTLSLLNVPIEQCSAAEFCLLFRHWSRLKNRKIGFAKVGLGDMYTHQARHYIEERGGEIQHNTSVKRIHVEDEKVKNLLVERNGVEEEIRADIYISTLNPLQLREALHSSVLESPFFQQLSDFKPVSYIAVNLWYDKKITHKQFWALIDDDPNRRYLNTDFYDQSNIYRPELKHSFITSNIIFSEAYDDWTDSEIVRKTEEELREAFPNHDGKVVHSHVHRIPYVVYAPYTGMRSHKLSHHTPFENFYLAGDWTAPETQCMEAAVRSAYRCAEIVLGNEGVRREIYSSGEW